jgi:DNA-binding NarL/FixJ family response regulator
MGEESTMQTTILLADDHQIVRQGLRQLLEAQPDLTVIGEAEDGYSAVDLAERLRPDIVLMDIWMPHLSGVDATRRIVRGESPTKVLVLSMHKARSYVEQALRAGASGYLLKDLGANEVVAAIRAVRSGQCYLSPAISRQLVDAVSNPGPAEPSELLTDREREVLQNIAEGLSSKEIAGLLGVSLKTVEAHRANLMEKLGIHKVSGLVRFAIREGLVAP